MFKFPTTKAHYKSVPSNEGAPLFEEVLQPALFLRLRSNCVIFPLQVLNQKLEGLLMILSQQRGGLYKRDRVSVRVGLSLLLADLPSRIEVAFVPDDYDRDVHLILDQLNLHSNFIDIFKGLAVFNRIHEKKALSTCNSLVDHHAVILITSGIQNLQAPCLVIDEEGLGVSVLQRWVVVGREGVIEVSEYKTTLSYERLPKHRYLVNEIKLRERVLAFHVP